tara:strand:+ start:701 stop:1291 length:591 start_codon:yes stop_codon:yes gene_type:complete
MFDEQIYRRFNHTVAACFVIFFLFPQKVFGSERIYLAIILWIVIITIEYLRLKNKFELVGMRDYEQTRVAGFVWFATGTSILFIFTEMGAFPQSIAIATIIMAAYTDPVIGEANRNLGGNWGLGLGFLCAFLIYVSVIGSIFYSVMGALVAVIVERPKLKWFDDDLAMQIFPAAILSILWLSGLGPDITETIVEGL